MDSASLRKAAATAKTASVTSNKAAAYDDEIHISDQPWTASNFIQKLNWLHLPLLFLTPAIGIYGLLTVEIQRATLIWTLVWYFMTGIGITAGYHRYWSHRSYNATTPLKIYLSLVGAGAVEGSIRWWSRDHRAHHRYTDTDKDPYSVKKGLFYAHIGWMLIKQNPKKIGRADITDLNNDPIVRFQHKYYLPLALFFGFIFPTLVAGLGWGDWAGGYFFAGVLRLVFVHHATFCVNSLAHWLGDQPFDDRHSPKNHFITALCTLGEGYHNFHHEFPTDFRNAIKFYQYDPTKWFISALKAVGLASNLKTFSENEVQKGMVQMEQKKLNEKSSKLDWGLPLDKLPVVEFEEYEEMAQHEPLILVSGIVHNVGKFINEHPGGKALIASGIGKDMTAAFNGGIYEHSNAAHNLLSTMRVAVVRGGMDVEVWRRLPKEDTTTGIFGKAARIGTIPIYPAGQQPTKVQ
eukprot:TRINITY_DN381_c0_g1_i1.p1 TRINITY_DN381_c0_g1~~TRINITY_DN381_c0_g1_i1.p1  ORF type:complete len:463 (+),score=150.33 TRINITY_DN381_c0_g1_i1:79-1467(+)